MNRDVCEHFNPVDLPCEKCKEQHMNREDIVRMAREAGFLPGANPVMPQLLERFAALVAAAEREDLLNTIDALYDAEQGRHPMFSEGYNHALLHIEESVKARK